MNVRASGGAALVFALVAAWFVATPARGILTLDQIKPGMRGYGKTVISGTKISRFDVRIVDIMRSDGATPDYLFIKVGGAEIEAAGGISAGMSGSPIYINNNLVGAVAFTTEYSNTLYGYATPIEYMLPLLEGENSASAGRGAGSSLWAALARCQSPVMVAGLSHRGFLRLSERLSRCGLRAVQGGGSARAGRGGWSKAVEPGAAIGIQLIRGAVNVTALGTMTYVQGNRFVAFGHSFIHHGRANFPLVRTVIHQSVPSTQLPFRVGSPLGPVIGTVTQDREAGVGGVLGEKPALAELSLELGGEELAKPRTLRCELVRDRQLTPELAGIAVLGLIEAVLDRAGGGTAAYRAEVVLEDGRVARREDVVCDSEDLAGQVGLEVQDILLALTENPVRPADVRAIRLAVNCARELAEAEIAGVSASPQTVSPGEEVEVRVVLKPFRRPEEMVRLRIAVPADVRARALRVRVHGKSCAELLKYEPWDDQPAPASLDDVVEGVATLGRRSEVVCDLERSPLEELMGFAVGRALPLLEGPTTELRDLPERPEAPAAPELRRLARLWTLVARSTLKTRYVVRGERSAVVNLRGPGEGGAEG